MEFGYLKNFRDFRDLRDFDGFQGIYFFQMDLNGFIGIKDQFKWI